MTDLSWNLQSCKHHELCRTCIGFYFKKLLVLSLWSCWYYFWDLKHCCWTMLKHLSIFVYWAAQSHAQALTCASSHHCSCLSCCRCIGWQEVFFTISLLKCPCTCPILRLLSRHTCSILYYLYLRLHMHHKPKYMHLSNFSPLLTLQPVPESLPVADHGSSAAAKAKAKVRICNFCYLSFTSTT